MVLDSLWIKETKQYGYSISEHLPVLWQSEHQYGFSQFVHEIFRFHQWHGFFPQQHTLTLELLSGWQLHQCGWVLFIKLGRKEKFTQKHKSPYPVILSHFVGGTWVDFFIKQLLIVTMSVITKKSLKLASNPPCSDSKMTYLHHLHRILSFKSVTSTTDLLFFWWTIPLISLSGCLLCSCKDQYLHEGILSNSKHILECLEILSLIC